MSSSSSSLALLARMKQLREKSAAQTAVTCITSDCAQPTSLLTYLRICSKAKHECYTNYMYGAKVLYKFLAPIAIPEIDSKLLPTSRPFMFSWSDVREIAKIVCPHNDRSGFAYRSTRMNYVESVIVYLLCKEVLNNEY